MSTLYLIRGLPGAGKTTLAKSLDAEHFEADMFMVDKAGNYKFDKDRLSECHAKCQAGVKAYMELVGLPIAVSNTFTKDWEMAIYRIYAEQNNYKVVTLIVENRHNGQNIHGVDEAVIGIMRERFEVKL